MIDYNDIEWGAPPPNQHRGPGAVQAFVAVLKTRPNEWAKYPHPYLRPVLLQNRKRFPECEWEQRKNDDGTYIIYGRWVAMFDGEGGHK